MYRIKTLLIITCFTLACIAVFLFLPAVAQATGGPAHTETLAAGPYIVDVNLYQDPPVTDQSIEVTVVPEDSHLQLSGEIITAPGLGTDAVPLHSPLETTDQTNVLVGSIRMPVRGAWNIIVQLDGPRGRGQASFPILVAGPGAIPIWLAWLIALAPLSGVVWLVWHQYRYRRKLLARAER